LNTLRDLVTLTFDLWTLESRHVMPLGCSTPVPNTLAITTYNDVLCAGCPKMRPVAPVKKEKRKKLPCVKLAIWADYPRRQSPLKICIRGRVRKVFMKIGRGVSELWRVENRPLPSTSPIAYSTACTTVQAVIYKSIFYLNWSKMLILHILTLMVAFQDGSSIHLSLVKWGTIQNWGVCPRPKPHAVT